MIDRFKKLPAFFFGTPSGNEPVRDWIKGLSSEDRQLIGRDVQKGRFWLADRDAILPQPWKRALGSAQRPDRRKNRPGNFLRCPWAHGAAPRLHQKDSEDAG